MVGESVTRPLRHFGWYLLVMQSSSPTVRRWDQKQARQGLCWASGRLAGINTNSPVLKLPSLVPGPETGASPRKKKMVRFLLRGRHQTGRGSQSRGGTCSRGWHIIAEGRHSAENAEAAAGWGGGPLTGAVLLGRAAESESKPELKSAGVDHFGRSRSRSWNRQNFAGFHSGPQSSMIINRR